MHKIEVSVIVPIFNAEKHLARCINSLLDQTHPSLEIIAIDDGSTDNSLEILHSFQKQHKSRLKVYHHENKGVSATRNFGVKQARGQFLGFVDSDDYVSNTMFKNLYDIAISSESDIAVCGFNIDDGHTVRKTNFKKAAVHDVNFKFIKNVFLSPEYRTAVWNKLYRADMIKDNCLFTNFSYVHSEDTLFNFHAILKATRIATIPSRSYFHQRCIDSLSVQKKYKNVTTRNANMIIEMYNAAQFSHKQFAYPLIQYFCIQGISNIAELEINHNKTTGSILQKLFLEYRKEIVKNTEIRKINAQQVLPLITPFVKKIFYQLLIYSFNQNNAKLQLIFTNLKVKKRLTK